MLFYLYVFMFRLLSDLFEGCGHCKAMKPAFSEAAAILKAGNVSISTKLFNNFIRVRVHSHVEDAVLSHYCSYFIFTANNFHENWLLYAFLAQN